MKKQIKKNFSRRFLNLEKKLPLEKFIPVAFLIFLLCVFILSIITYRYIEIYKSDINWINHANDVIKKIETTKLQISRLQLSWRGYIITRDTLYLNSYDSLKEQSRSEIEVLKKMTFDNKPQLQLLEAMDSLYNENLIVMDSSIIFLNGNQFREDFQIDEMNTVQANLREINNKANEIRNTEYRFLNMRSEKASSANSNIQLFILATGLLSFFVIGLSLFISDKLIKNKNQAERLLIKSYEDLEDKIDKRTVELKYSNEKLSDEIKVREKTEQTLRESDQRFRLMADSAPVLIWIAGQDKLRTYFNKVWLDFTGRTLEQESGTNWMDDINPEDLKKFIDVYESTFDKRIPYEIEYRLRNAESEYLWILEKGIPRFEGDEFVGFIGTCIDINQRKKNENFLKIQYDVSKTLAESKTIKEASEKLLKNICSGINWNFGILWTVDKNKENLGLESLWSDNDEDLKNYSGIYDKFNTFSKNADLPGYVIKEKKSQWLTGINTDKNFIRRDAADRMGWHSGLGIPISNGTDVIAIVECFNKKSIEEKQDLTDVLESAGRQIGNFIERKIAEESLRLSYLELEEKVRERTSELAAALTKLVKESEDKEVIQNKIRLFLHAIKSIKDCVYITDLDNKTIFINKAFELTYGFGNDEIIGAEIPILRKINLSPNLKNDIINKTLDNGWKGELITYRKSGTGFPTYLSTSTIRNDDAKVEAIVGICQDITGMKNTEELIKKRNNLLNVLNDVIRYTNKTFDFYDAVRYSINKICEYTHWEAGHYFLRKNDILISSKIWNEGLSGNYFPLKEVTEKMSFKSGEEYPGKTLLSAESLWVSIKDLTDRKLYKRSEITTRLGLNTGIWVPVIMENEVIGVMEFFKKDEQPEDREVLDCIINIGLELGNRCEKLQSIEKIKQSEKLLIDAQHIAKLGSWDWDVPNNKITWSDEMYFIYGINKEDFELTYENYIKFIHPDDIETTRNIVTNAIAKKSSFSYYHRIITPSGKIKFLKAQGEIYLDENENVVRMFGTGHDVTEIRKAEEDLKRTNAKLIETQKELIYNEKLAALGRFSSGIAHEIRNPLANINSLAQLISKANIDEKNKRRLNYIVTNVEIANKIIKNLLSYASPEDLDFSYINLSEILGSILESVEARCKNNNVRIIRKIQVNLPLLYLDKLKLENAFMNFVSNSIEAMSDGGTLTVKVYEDKNKGEINIHFTDTGVGIPAENMDKILEPFFTTKDEGVGLGMGLAYQTIRLHHGVFQIQSIDGKGTHIEIKLPVNKSN